MVNATDADGNAVDVDTTPFIWEVENRDAFKTMGDQFTKLSKMRRYHHSITSCVAVRKYHYPMVAASMYLTQTLTWVLRLTWTTMHRKYSANFMAWIQNYNTYI